MNTNSPTVSDLSIAQIEYYMDRYEQLLDQGDAELAEFFRSQAEELAHTLDSDSEVLTMTYHRYLSESFGLVFEEDHGDPELKFGGV